MTGEFSIAVHAMVYLNHKGETVSSEVLASNVCTNPARIRKVMAKLKKAGLIVTKEGVDGGYHGGEKVGQVNLCQIAEALDIHIVEVLWKSGNPDMACLISSGMADIMDSICLELNQSCKDRLRRITIADIDSKIFAEGSFGGCSSSGIKKSSGI